MENWASGLPDFLVALIALIGTATAAAKKVIVEVLSIAQLVTVECDTNRPNMFYAFHTCPD